MKSVNIKQWLIGYFRQYKKDGIEKYANGLKVDDIIAWLEKQDESTSEVIIKEKADDEAEVQRQKLIDTVNALLEPALKAVKETERKAKRYDEALKKARDVYTYYCEDSQQVRKIESIFPELKENSTLKSVKEDVEDDSIIEIKPKFKVGDFIITSEGIVLQITRIKDTYYKFNNESHYWEIRYCDEKCRLWTIKDAKDGDVLFYDDGWTCIFKNSHGIWYSSYCFITSDGEFHTGYKRHAINATINDNAHPATKKQRDLLFQKMKEAGYEWDAENKELKKILQT